MFAGCYFARQTRLDENRVLAGAYYILVKIELYHFQSTSFLVVFVVWVLS